jgi:hypothetical protein
MSRWPWETPPVGVYFGMSFEEYISIPCLNASGIKELNISETDFWARSWMNPDNDYVDEDTKAKIEGRAYHKRILEGQEAFDSQYALEYEDDGDSMTLRGNDEMKAALTSLDIKGLSGKNADYLDAMCGKYLPQYKTLYRLKKSHKELAGDRELISPKLMRHIEFTAKMIELHPDTREYFKGGFSEVTVIFEAFGVIFKARFDYLKVWEASDLKTFANTTRAELHKAVRKAFANNKYHIQGTLYLIALDIAKRYVSMGKVYQADHVPENWLELFSKTPCNQLKYAFVQKGIAPACVPLVFTKEDKAFEMGFEIIKNGVDRFTDAYKNFGQNYWVTSLREEIAHYEDMPPWINDV